MYIMSIGSYITFDILTILRENATDLIIPNGYFGRAAITSFSISDNKDLMRIDIGNNTFGSVRSFELISKIRVLVLIHRSSSITVCGTWWLCIRWCSFSCVWEWLNEWIDDSDLPKLQSIELGSHALQGDWRDDRKLISTVPYYYKNTLTMRSEIGWNDEWIDLPSLISFKGYRFNFWYIGSVILESSHLVIDWIRYPSIIIQWNPIQW